MTAPLGPRPPLSATSCRRRASPFTSGRSSAAMALQNVSSLSTSVSAAPATRHRASASRPRRMSVCTAAAVVAAGLACCWFTAPLQAEAFFLPPTTTTLRTHSARLAPTTSTTIMAAKGFGKSVEPSPPTPATAGGAAGAGGGGMASGEGGGGEGGGVESWEKEYKAYIKRTGQYLCSMSWEGHEEMGRGAIFANYDDARKDGKLNDMDKFGGIPSMYVPLTEFESMKAAGKEAGEEDDLEQIVKRVKAYTPEKEFVVVFQAAGIMGADIVRPNVSPPEMAKHVVKSNGVSTMPSASASGLDGVIDVN